MRRSSAGACSGAVQRLGALAFLDLLRLLLGLPEEEIGADRGPQDRHHHGQVPRRQGKARDHQMIGDLAPVQAHHQRHADIGEEGQGQPFEHRNVALVAHEHLQQHRGGAEQDHIGQRRPADHQLQRRRHGAEIRAQVDGVGDDQERNQGEHHDARIVPLQVAGDTAARHPSDPRADFLDGAHQRPAKEEGPAEVEAELRAGLGIGGDAAGIVVRGAGDESGAQDLEHIGLGARRAALFWAHAPSPVPPLNSTSRQPGSPHGTIEPPVRSRISHR